MPILAAFLAVTIVGTLIAGKPGYAVGFGLALIFTVLLIVMLFRPSKNHPILTLKRLIRRFLRSLARPAGMTM